ncbi:MAG: sigma-70 family RNA polymerase sigma factor [Kiritimatiellia bacterium]
MDTEAWITQLVETHEKGLCRYACRLAGSEAMARDAVQETFLRLCRADRSKVEGHEAPWLFRVCRSRVFDLKKKEKPMQQMTPEHVDRHASSGEGAVPNALQERLNRVTELLNRLPERQREVIQLKFQQEMSYREISEVLGISEGNVGFLIHTGIKTLRERIHTLSGVQS